MEKPEYLASATLMFLGDDLDPDMVTKKLSLTPTNSWSRGDLKGYGDTTYEWGGWKLFYPTERKRDLLEEQLTYWCDLLHEKVEAISLLKSLDLHASLRIYIITSNTATIIVPSTLQDAIARLGLELEICFSTSPA